MRAGNTPLVSVVTVNLDDAAGLRRTARSIFFQSKRLEWIVVDGHSVDNSRAVAEDFLVGMSGCIFEVPPEGIYSAMNFGAEKATGEWIWFLNSGDYVFSPENFEKLMTQLEKTDSNVVVSSVYHITPNGFLFSISDPRISRLQLETNHQGVLVKRSLFEKIGGFDLSFRLAADGKFLDTAAQIGVIYKFPEPFVAFELGGRSGVRYRETINEIRRYRGEQYSTNDRTLFLRNTFRLMLINYSGRAYRNLINQYFKYREQRMIRRVAMGPAYIQKIKEAHLR
jgi:glycosyltransferase involved in cell wall biosynthesis